MSMTSCSGTFIALATRSVVGTKPMRSSLAFSLRKLKNSLRCVAVVPIRTMREFCRMYRRMYARIHHAA